MAAGTMIMKTILRPASRSPPVVGKMRESIIIFTRYPEPGKTKTRLIPALGEEGSAGVHRELTIHTLIWARRLHRSRAVSLEVHFEGGNEDRMKAWLGPDLVYRPQPTGDLGERMAEAFRGAFQRGTDRVAIVGTDCPGVTAELAERAVEALRDRDVVLGPALDGGYYLIGLRRLIPELFMGVHWGSREVLEETLEAARKAGAKFHLLDFLGDVDRSEDLRLFHRYLAAKRPTGRSPIMSVIIPALNEAESIAGVLSMVLGSPLSEVIVVDGGSADGTPRIAAEYGARVLRTAPSRARQMNAGAAAARGEVLLFLHADTYLPAGFEEHVVNAVERPGAVAGAFELGIDASGWGLRLIERMANWRSRRLHMPYGDQALFLKRALFQDLGGFPEMEIMEDYELVRRLRRRGKIVILGLRVRASARRWLRLGVWKTTLTNQIVILGYHLGVPARLLARLYGPAGGPKPGGRSPSLV